MQADKRIKELETEIACLKKELGELRDAKERTFAVPETLESPFVAAEKAVHDHFNTLEFFPSEGKIVAGGHRYLLVRGDSLGYHMLNDIMSLYADRDQDESFRIARNMLFDVAHLLGKEDAQFFHQKMGLTDPISKLSAGPVHFAYTGWARVELQSDSNMTPDENYVIRYTHPNSFEADAWLEKGQRSEYPVCAMNSGYSSGWCEQSFGIELTAVELTCRACGDEHCSFIMAPPSRIQELLKKEKHRSVNQRYDVPLFFERKKMEEAIAVNLKEKEVMLKEIHHRVKNNLQIVTSLLNLQANAVGDEILTQYIRESQNRVKAMALLHEALYSSGNLTALNPEEYFRGIITNIRMTYGIEYDTVKVILNVDDRLQSINPDDAIPCGLILNELVSNCMKHAFLNRQGIVNIQFRLNDSDNTVLLEVSDNGRGIQNGDSNSTGLTITEVLADQLNGRFSIHSSPEGTIAAVVFPWD
jgi:two-component sensor histidine kinase/predicted hydrocarbon binding protein